MSFRSTIRAVFPVAVTWGFVWGLYGILWLVPGMLRIYREYGNIGSYSIEGILGSGIMSGIVGTIAGLIFLSIFERAERGGRVEEISRWRVSAWGGLTGLIYIALIVGLRALVGAQYEASDLLWNTFWALGLGAGSGALTIAIARRGQLPTPVEVRELDA